MVCATKCSLAVVVFLSHFELILIISELFLNYVLRESVGIPVYFRRVII